MNSGKNKGFTMKVQNLVGLVLSFLILVCTSGCFTRMNTRQAGRPDGSYENTDRSWSTSPFFGGGQTSGGPVFFRGSLRIHSEPYYYGGYGYYGGGGYAPTRGPISRRREIRQYGETWENYFGNDKGNGRDPRPRYESRPGGRGRDPGPRHDNNRSRGRGSPPR